MNIADEIIFSNLEEKYFKLFGNNELERSEYFADYWHRNYLLLSKT